MSLDKLLTLEYGSEENETDSFVRIGKVHA